MGQFDWVQKSFDGEPVLFSAVLVEDVFGSSDTVDVIRVDAVGVETTDRHLPWSAIKSLTNISGAQPRCVLCDAPIGVGFSFCHLCRADFCCDDDDPSVWPADGEAGVLRRRVAALEAELAALRAAPAPAPIVPYSPDGWLSNPSLCLSCGGPTDPGTEHCADCVAGVAPVREECGAPARRSFKVRAASPAWRKAAVSWRADGPSAGGAL